MRYKVPQFIEVEDKLFGPLTFRQALFCAGGVGFFVLVYSFLPFIVAIFVGGPVVAFGFALAFYKRDGMSFTALMESGFYYFTRNKLYIWKHHDKPLSGSTKKSTDVPLGDMYVPKLTESKLKDLAWSLDIKEHMK